MKFHYEEAWMQKLKDSRPKIYWSYFLFVIYYKNHDIPKTFPCISCINIVTLPRKPLKDKAMGTSKPQTCDNAKQQEAANADVVKKDKKPFKLTVVTKEELEQLRIPVYPYIL